jgi:hypothetical protein
MGMRAMKLSILFFCAAASGCGYDLLGNEGFEIDCDDRPCDWKLIEGSADLTASWHAGDSGADLSGAGRVAIEQRSAPFALPGRELVAAGPARPTGTGSRSWSTPGPSTSTTAACSRSRS